MPLAFYSDLLYNNTGNCGFGHPNLVPHKQERTKNSMVSKVMGIGLAGLDGYAVEVETDLRRSQTDITDIVGLPDTAVREAKNRIRTALSNSGFHLPDVGITINLAPANIKKEGSAFDLPMLLGILSAAEKIPPLPEKAAFWGEISLSGEVRPCAGVLAAVITAKNLGFEEIYLPAGNAAEGRVIKGIKVYGVPTLSRLVGHIRSETPIPPEIPTMDGLVQNREPTEDFSSVIGQAGGKRACEIAAAGGHNLLFIGPPGTGKSMLAKCLPSILPDMTFDEIIQSSKIYSVAGKLSQHRPLVTSRPFVKANQGISAAGLAGGGASPTPGLISLAHNGVLFIDEMPEFPVRILEILRQPMEDGNITISRVKKTLTYPANFMLVCAMNPCPCGNFGHPSLQCTCRPGQVSKYISRISGPLLDRIDLQVELPPVPVTDLKNRAPAETSAEIKKRVDKARNMQRERFAKTGCLSNARMNRKQIESCRMTAAARNALEYLFEKNALSMRAYDRIIKVARTIADLAESDEIQEEHIAEAGFFRSLDKKYWNKV